RSGVTRPTHTVFCEASFTPVSRNCLHPAVILLSGESVRDMGICAMKTMCRSLCAVCVLFLVALPALASDLTISQFRVRGPDGGNDEFVELHNGSAAPVDVSGYRLNASNASGTVGTRATLPAGTSI